VFSFWLTASRVVICSQLGGCVSQVPQAVELPQLSVTDAATAGVTAVLVFGACATGLGTGIADKHLRLTDIYLCDYTV
jgi:hypothetical protein